MKRILLSLLLAVVFLPMMWAGDIIVTTSSERIDAKIVEVSETEIKYKRQDNLNGPTFVLSTSKIATIIYANGSVQAFEQKKQQPTTTTYGSGAINTSHSSDYRPGMIEKKGDYYWLGDTRMDEEQYFAYIQKNCEAAWDSYRLGNRLWRAGFGLLGAGGGIWLTGLIVTCTTMGTYTYTYNVNTGQIYNSSLKVNWDQYYAGVSLLAIGSAALTASVPLIVVGAIKRNNSHNVYNEECAPKNTAALSLDLQASQNGLGLALKF